MLAQHLATLALDSATITQAVEGSLTGKAGQDIRIDSGVSTLSITNNSFARGSSFLISGASTINKSLDGPSLFIGSKSNSRDLKQQPTAQN